MSYTWSYRYTITLSFFFNYRVCLADLFFGPHLENTPERAPQACPQRHLVFLVDKRDCVHMISPIYAPSPPSLLVPVPGPYIPQLPPLSSTRISFPYSRELKGLTRFPPSPHPPLMCALRTISPAISQTKGLIPSPHPPLHLGPGEVHWHGMHGEGQEAVQVGLHAPRPQEGRGGHPGGATKHAHPHAMVWPL